MNAQPQNVQTILARIDALERQNQRLKRAVFGGLVLLATAALCVVSAGGQQAKEHSQITTPSATSAEKWEKYVQTEDDTCTKAEVTLPASLPASAFPDYKMQNSVAPTILVRWDNNTSIPAKEIALSRVIAEVPTMRDKVRLLACMAEALQVEVNDLRSSGATVSMLDKVFAALSSHEKTINNHAALIDQIGALAADDDSRIRAMQNGLGGANPQLDDLRKELAKFKDAACPILRTARMDYLVKSNLDSTCGLH